MGEEHLRDAMLQLAQTFGRLSLAAPLWGADRLADLLRAGGGGRRSGAPTLGGVAAHGGRPLREPLRLVFQAGDDLQREGLDLLARTLGAGGNGGGWQATADLATRAWDAFRSLTPGPDGLASWQEFLNKQEVYRVVRQAGTMVDPGPEAEGFNLVEGVRQAYGHGPHRAMWVVEGLAHDRVLLALRRGASARSVLDPGTLEKLPEESLLMVHAGMGLAVAEHELSRIGPALSDEDVGAAVDRFRAACRAASLPAHEAAALESLGLMARCFFPHLVAAIDRRLGTTGAGMPTYFWHGVGRAIYFLPVHFLPGVGTLGHALDMLRREAPRPAAWERGLAGLAWAITTVNLHHPRVLERALKHHGRELEDTPFAEAMVDSVVHRHGNTPGAPFIPAFFRHRPDGSDIELAKRWRRMVGDPLERALGDLYG